MYLFKWMLKSLICVRSQEAEQRRMEETMPSKRSATLPPDMNPGSAFSEHHQSFLEKQSAFTARPASPPPTLPRSTARSSSVSGSSERSSVKSATQMFENPPCTTPGMAASVGSYQPVRKFGPSIPLTSSSSVSSPVDNRNPEPPALPSRNINQSHQDSSQPSWRKPASGPVAQPSDVPASSFQQTSSKPSSYLPNNGAAPGSIQSNGNQPTTYQATSINRSTNNQAATSNHSTPTPPGCNPSSPSLPDSIINSITSRLSTRSRSSSSSGTIRFVVVSCYLCFVLCFFLSKMFRVFVVVGYFCVCNYGHCGAGHVASSCALLPLLLGM